MKPGTSPRDGPELKFDAPPRPRRAERPESRTRAADRFWSHPGGRLGRPCVDVPDRRKSTPSRKLDQCVRDVTRLGIPDLRALE